MEVQWHLLNLYKNMDKNVNTKQEKSHVIDAQGKKLGRVATQAAILLMGKNTPAFAKNIVPDVQVSIINISKVYISAKKKETKTYASHSQYLGGIRTQKMAQLIEQKGLGEIFRRAVFGMLPTNKLRKQMIKNLTVTL